MKRNENRTWYDKGYSDGVQDTIKDSKLPKLIGVACRSILLVFDQYWILAFVVIWGLFELQEWHDKNKYHESNPPKQWSE